MYCNREYIPIQFRNIDVPRIIDIAILYNFKLIFNGCKDKAMEVNEVHYLKLINDNVNTGVYIIIGEIVDKNYELCNAKENVFFSEKSINNLKFVDITWPIHIIERIKQINVNAFDNIR
jgi:hypothetical protein